MMRGSGEKKVLTWGNVLSTLDKSSTETKNVGNKLEGKNMEMIQAFLSFWGGVAVMGLLGLAVIHS